MDTILKLILVASLSVLAFSLGTYAGKAFHDAQQKVDNATKGE